MRLPSNPNSRRAVNFASGVIFEMRLPYNFNVSRENSSARGVRSTIRLVAQYVKNGDSPRALTPVQTCYIGLPKPPNRRGLLNARRLAVYSVARLAFPALPAANSRSGIHRVCCAEAIRVMPRTMKINKTFLNMCFISLWFLPLCQQCDDVFGQPSPPVFCSKSSTLAESLSDKAAMSTPPRLLAVLRSVLAFPSLVSQPSANAHPIPTEAHSHLLSMCRICPSREC